MCYALLTTCRECTWLLNITYPLCSHARAYAIDPPACPHRMKRRYKAEGLCTACLSKSNPSSSKLKLSSSNSKHKPSSANSQPKPKSTTKSKRGSKGETGSEIGERRDRNDSLSVTPCEVKISFRDTEIGVVEARDRVRSSKHTTPVPIHLQNPLSHTHTQIQTSPQTPPEPSEPHPQPEKHPSLTPSEDQIGLRKTRTRAKKRIFSITHPSSVGEDSDGDIYIASSSSSASLSSSNPRTPSNTSISSDDLLPRKHKFGTRSKPPPKPKRPMQTQKRKRSPGVLERIQNGGGSGEGKGAAAKKKDKRGRPPKAQRILWPDRVDAGAYAVVREEREAKGKGNANISYRQPYLPMPVLQERPFEFGFGGGKREMREERPSCGQRVGLSSGGKTGMGAGAGGVGIAKALTGEPTSKPASKVPYSVVEKEGDNLAKLIALEASKREKKWR